MQQDDFNLDKTVSVDISIPYRVYLPADYDASGRGYPMLYFLHGAGARGNALDWMARIA